MSDASDPAFEALLEFIRANRGFDFTGYKRSTLVRRVDKRMVELGIGEYTVYGELLASDAAEFTALFNTILINVTSFWRDPDAWETLTTKHLPALLASKADDSAVRVWSAGCASGEEAYTIVMAFAEALGVEAFRQRVKIYATDVDDEALATARAAVYDERALEAVPEPLRERYFEPTPGGGFAFRPDLRRCVIFGRHDLVRDAPIPHLDLLVSRNALMYFNADTQSRIVTRMHFALNDDGLLFLGKAEMMRAHASMFAPADLKSRIFRKVARGTASDRLLTVGARPRPDEEGRLLRQLRLTESALDGHPAAQIVLDVNGQLVLANGRARSIFGLAPVDMGRPIQDLTVSYRPVELRTHIEQAYAERRPAHIANVEYPTADGAIRCYDVFITPLTDAAHAVMGMSISFVDVTASHRLHAAVQSSNEDLETALEELQSSNEELETTNEELQSTIEELETTNEELQSTNEELETMNEELQSTNEELETINDELNRRTTELHDTNAYMTAILTSLQSAVAVLDSEAYVRVWNRRAEDMWGLRAEETVGSAFQNLDIGLPVERLKGPLRACMDGSSDCEQVTLEAINRRGRPIQCRVTCTPFAGIDRKVRGAVVVMEARLEEHGAVPEPSKNITV
ncbi:MAG TPA: CheR family methyltransferase [Longimicrobium sp.]|nr:CheR family methyltransferase [Longimicrobium sp.]